MDIETMPHAVYFTGDLDSVTKINHVPYQTIEYNDNGMFTAKLMNDTPIEIFIDNGATPSILPLCTYNKFPILLQGTYFYPIRYGPCLFLFMSGSLAYFFSGCA